MEFDTHSESSPLLRNVIESVDENCKDYVVESVGAFGVWQATMCAIAMSARFICTWNTLSILFLTPVTDFKCVKFYDNVIVDVANSSCYDNCAEYEFYQNVFDKTLISDFGLICNNAWLSSFTQTVLMFGLLLGVSCFGWVSDRFGRSITLRISGALSIFFMFTAPVAPNYWMFNISRFFVGFACGGTLTAGVVYIMEMTGPQYREVVGCLSFYPDALAQSSLAVFAYFSSNWMTYLLGYSAISLVFASLLFILPETPRWLIANGKFEEATKIMTKAAKRNKLNTDTISENVSKAIEITNQSERTRHTYFDLFSTDDLSLKIVSAFLIWTFGGFCFFGVNQYITFIASNLHATVGLLGLIQIPTMTLAMVLNKCFRRKVMVFSSLSLTGSSMICLIFTPVGHIACTIIGILSLASMSTTFAVLYVYMCELFPTPLRNMSYGLCSAGAKVGAMLAPFIATLSPHWIPSTIFAIIPFCSAAICTLLPETKGAILKDTIE